MKIRELSQGILDGSWTCEELVMTALARIAANDQSGRKLNSAAMIDPNALFYARAIDEEIRKNKSLKSPLHGVPVMLKDNIDIKGLPTTAGSYALRDLIAQEDAFITKKLREAGALILGKTNLSEFAYFMSRQNMPSGYSSLNGQVVHAYVPGRDPSGSSSGSAVAVSARFVPYTIGTETDGSLMSPAIANAVVSLKPTVGLVSRSGILPISHVQDTAGPMCTNVEDIADVLDVLAGCDPEDPATLTCRKQDYKGALTESGSGLRIGIFYNDTDEREKEALANAKAILEAAGTEVIPVEIETVRVHESDALMHEFKYGLNLYLSRHGSACRSLGDIIRFNREHPERCLKYGQDLLEKSDELSGRLTESEYILLRKELKETTDKNLISVLAENHLDCLMSAVDRTRLNLAPVSGCPCLALPAVSVKEEDFRPLSYYMMAAPYREDVLIRTAYILEKNLIIHSIPSWAEEFSVK